MPNPLQKMDHNQHKTIGHNPRVDLCPKSIKKYEKMGALREKWVSVWLGTKREIWGFGWPAMGGYGGEGPVVVSWWWGR
jgi:hypothetical protein